MSFILVFIGIMVAESEYTFFTRLFYFIVGT
jgi:cytochrome c oxidase subunit IV